MAEETHEEQQEQHNPVEEVVVAAGDVLNEIGRLIHEGNVRRVRVKQGDEVWLDVPLNIAAIGTLIAPVWVGLGVFGALAANCTLVVERAESAASADEARGGKKKKKKVSVEVKGEEEKEGEG